MEKEILCKELGDSYKPMGEDRMAGKEPSDRLKIKMALEEAHEQITQYRKELDEQHGKDFTKRQTRALHNILEALCTPTVRGW